MSADLSHVETWLFDLDNTLYPSDTGLGEEISDRITAYMARLTGLPWAEARNLQKRYLADHGLTLRGLMLHHGVDPDEFHALFHDMSLEVLARDADLTAALSRLPGRRLIFTNADAGHAARVLQRLGLSALFEDVFHIASADFIPKPSPQAFERLCAAHQVEPSATAFFEDIERNLEPAANLGMTTILVGEAAERPAAPFVRHRAPNLAAFLGAARLKERTT
jgi:putative hydrolase of the HAD superfamily